eukprot:TRINITY_DN7880_c0_g1_i1.p1 TRINITY_DN7880_c0_g1~~TRINITY_DN7880_c0_g1_i1.p1  ORF type:complete len:243 (-),score=34.84 TRINITY_DN7880_c0_g1_i1:45-773(-)
MIKYTRYNIFTSPGVEEQTSYYDGCSCYPVCEDQCSCPQGDLVFHRDKRIKMEGENQRPIFECNSECMCPPHCSNRVLQQGIQLPLQVFKIVSKGWGLRCTQDVAKGTFVCEYVGEYLSDADARDRQRNLYDPKGLNYILNINEHVGDRPIRTHIDGTVISNIARFVNHSCDPNLVTRVIRVDCDVPRIGLFANTNIPANTELTFDYGSTDESREMDPRKLYPCRCGAARCLGYLPFNPFVL